ncbi:MAG: hypothetical protein J3K34DRAFT_244059 [Monoraphidium minutum]|nr:MAG: hypothetical protein J3K34DRAFT_244059 [Monoraphidium minutum]
MTFVTLSLLSPSKGGFHGRECQACDRRSACALSSACLPPSARRTHCLATRAEAGRAGPAGAAAPHHSTHPGAGARGGPRPAGPPARPGWLAGGGGRQPRPPPPIQAPQRPGAPGGVPSARRRRLAWVHTPWHERGCGLGPGRRRGCRHLGLPTGRREGHPCLTAPRPGA